VAEQGGVEVRDRAAVLVNVLVARGPAASSNSSWVVIGRKVMPSA
jgi:hypothetical protein